MVSPDEATPIESPTSERITSFILGIASQRTIHLDREPRAYVSQQLSVQYQRTMNEQNEFSAWDIFSIFRSSLLLHGKACAVKFSLWFASFFPEWHHYCSILFTSIAWRGACMQNLLVPLTSGRYTIIT